MVVRLSAAAAFMADTFFATSALRRSFSSSVHFVFLTPIRSRGTPCCILASDYRGARSAQDVNLLHIPAELSLPTIHSAVGFGDAMAEYRVYLVDTDDNFFDVIPLFCEDDAEAIEQALQLAVGHGVELWQ